MHILLAIDGSEYSKAATNHLAKLPFAEPPNVTLVSALRETQTERNSGRSTESKCEEERERAEAAIEEATRTLEGRCGEIDSVVQCKHPSKLILSVAEQKKSDLIALGARGHNAVYRVIVGSTADFVTNHAKCSVLIARGAPPESQPWNVLLAYDGSEQSKVASHQLCTLGWPSDTNVHVAMVLERPKLIAENEVYDPPAIAESENQLEHLTVNSLGCHVKRSVRESLHIGTSIRGIAEDEGCNLMFFGATGKSAVARFFLGSVSHYLLHHAETSIWLARENHWE